MSFADVSLIVHCEDIAPRKITMLESRKTRRTLDESAMEEGRKCNEAGAKAPRKDGRHDGSERRAIAKNQNYLQH